METGVHDVATLLKEFFRDLPEPLIPKEVQPALLAIQRKCILKMLWNHLLLRCIFGPLNITLQNYFFFLYFFSGLKNTQDQIIHLQHIIQLLPLINRDTLYVLLQFLGLVAENAEDRTDEAGKRKNT